MQSALLSVDEQQRPKKNDASDDSMPPSPTLKPPLKAIAQNNYEHDENDGTNMVGITQRVQVGAALTTEFESGLLSIHETSTAACSNNRVHCRTIPEILPVSWFTAVAIPGPPSMQCHSVGDREVL